MKKAMYGTRRASFLFLEFMVDVFRKCDYEPPVVSRQVFYNKQYDSLATLHGDDILVEGEPEAIDHLDAVIRPLCNITSCRGWDLTAAAWVATSCATSVMCRASATSGTRTRSTP